MVNNHNAHDIMESVNTLLYKFMQMIVNNVMSCTLMQIIVKQYYVLKGHAGISKITLRVCLIS